MKFILSALLTFPVLLCFGHSNFLPGYVVTSTGDTINGDINYMNWEQNPRKIEFRHNGKDVSILGLNDLIAFEITGHDKYEKYLVLKSGRPKDFTQLYDAIPGSSISDTVFLRILVTGKVNLYELVDKRAYYFIGVDDGEPRELEHWLEPQSQSGDFYTRNTYKNQLLQLIAELPVNKVTNNRIDNSSYTEKNLTDIVNQINLLKGEQQIQKRSQRKKTIIFLLVVALMLGK